MLNDFLGSGHMCQDVLWHIYQCMEIFFCNICLHIPPPAEPIRAFLACLTLLRLTDTAVLMHDCSVIDIQLCPPAPPAWRLHVQWLVAGPAPDPAWVPAAGRGSSLPCRGKRMSPRGAVPCCWQAAARRSNMPKQTNKMSVSSIAYQRYPLLSICPFLNSILHDLSPYQLHVSSPMHIRPNQLGTCQNLVVSRRCLIPMSECVNAILGTFVPQPARYMPKSGQVIEYAY